MEAFFRSDVSDEVRARAARASQIAADYHHDRVDLAHFVLALIEPPSRAVGMISKESYRGFRDTRRRVRNYLAKLPQADAMEQNLEDLPITSRLNVILMHAKRLAKRTGSKLVSNEHIFLALATEDFYSEAERGAVGARLLSPMEMTPNQIERILFGPPSDGGMTKPERPAL
jgi:ATP-dependent Clp protease ATP-binding subunit ClpA